MAMEIINWLFIVGVFFGLGAISLGIAQIPFVKRWIMRGYED